MNIDAEFLMLIGVCITATMVATMGTLFGNGHFVSFPLWQTFFPGMSFAQIVGTTKCGGVTRGIATTISTWKQLDFHHNFFILIPLLIGTFWGATFIGHLEQKFMFFALLFAIFLAEFSPKLSLYINNKNKLLFAFAIGVYNGFLGAGAGIMMFALMRISFPHDHQIIHAKIQARFIEFITILVAISAHIIHGTIIWKLGIAWGIGAFFGGLIGAKILKKWGTMSGKKQKIILRLSFLFAIVVSGVQTLSIW